MYVYAQTCTYFVSLTWSIDHIFMYLFLREIYWMYVFVSYCSPAQAATLGELLALLLCDNTLGFCSSLVFIFELFGH